jgi:hypothetical protein
MAKAILQAASWETATFLENRQSSSCSLEPPLALALLYFDHTNIFASSFFNIHLIKFVLKITEQTSAERNYTLHSKQKS